MPRRIPLLVVLTRHLVAVAAVGGIGAGSAQAVAPDWITVGDPGNPADTTGAGSVADVYRISKFETTNSEYAEFLNAVADTDLHLLYTPGMASGSGGIVRSGSSGSYTYSATAGRENKPVNFVDFFGALRFANWLHNGQPTGAQDDTTTEDGAYTLTPGGIADNSIVRNPDALAFLPSRDEWYKAAYYDAVSSSYFAYPAGSHTQTTCAAPGATANTANCGGAVGDFSDVGSYTGSASPIGTFDQGGNVWEWNEEIFAGKRRRVRGGSFDFAAVNLAASVSLDTLPTSELNIIGFRIGSFSTLFTPLPEPGTAVLLPLLGFAFWRKQQTSQMH